ncbi:PREDICTED: UDP-glycosyltransferase 86A1-like [Erythranthe guttata]|uniref:UDP-glycosyltransferase 86A1-like n=1 Tax=Erythranthe guttata TaxID=4155 RepID=UPI00064DA934|nr:PREDICTED: UDP-glycosyltransferase 86A1-like [Erythranthe guttata]|eukprot:XP_012838263.1 PREDICTED: UDP-glycosyltransferase 86A1-like [Erythranthe guttata]
MSYLEGDNDPFNIPTVLYQNIIDASSPLTPWPHQFLRHPTNNNVSTSTNTTATTSLWPEVDCQKWLDSKPHGSVLYISFGSTIETNTQLIHEIAHGLMLSQQRVNFIWILRRNLVRITSDDDDDLLPPGFEDCVGDRGLVIPWCNQSLVLSDPRIGCFLTHCGWNSVLESIWHGVPMICFPLSVDQPTNRKLVVDDWKIGINLCDDQTKQISRQQVAQKIDHLMSSGITSLRREIKKVETILHRAWAADGSSNGNLDRFLHDLKAKTHSKSSAN